MSVIFPDESRFRASRIRLFAKGFRVLIRQLRCHKGVIASVFRGLPGALLLALTLAACPVQAQEAEKPKAIRLFGTVEFRGPLKGVPAWLSVMERNGKNPIFYEGSKFNSSTTWDDLRARLAGQPAMEQLKIVNRFWNQWPYRLDQDVWGKPDYWAIPDEFRKKSGDCEDYAIVKYYTLKEIGFKTEQMRIVVVMETLRNIAHAVLVVYLDGDAYVLDNLSNNVLSHTRVRSYVPQFSVNEQFRWAHVKPK